MLFFACDNLLKIEFKLIEKKNYYVLDTFPILEEEKNGEEME